MANKSILASRIADGSFTAAVVGIGRVGLPLAITLAQRGVRVYGVDRDPEHVATVNRGQLPFIEHGAGEVLSEVLSSTFEATTDCQKAVSEADVVFLTVGTPLGADLRPDNSALEQAVVEIGSALSGATLVIARSTVSPGTTERVIVPALLAHSDQELGDELFVAFCPERIAEGKAMAELQALPEIVGGVDEASCSMATDVFLTINPDKIVHQTDPLSAELAKLYTNVFRYVTFALANEYALIAEHYRRDAHRIIAMLRDGYERAPVPLPGPSGGPCLTKDGYFLIEELTFPDFVLTAWKLNDSVPAHLVNRLQVALEKRGSSLTGAKVAVLGQAFKADIDDDRLSPSLRVIASLERLGAEVAVHDPYLFDTPLDDVLRDADAIVIATNHRHYRDLEAKAVAELVADGCVVADAWALLEPGTWAAEGIEVVTFGRG